MSTDGFAVSYELGETQGRGQILPMHSPYRRPPYDACGSAGDHTCTGGWCQSCPRCDVCRLRLVAHDGGVPCALGTTISTSSEPEFWD